jgi:hypothetical protein
MKLDRARSGLTLIRNYRLICSEPQARILTVRYLSKPKRILFEGATYIEWKPGQVPISQQALMRLTVA